MYVEDVKSHLKGQDTEASHCSVLHGVSNAIRGN